MPFKEEDCSPVRLPNGVKKSKANGFNLAKGCVSSQKCHSSLVVGIEEVTIYAVPLKNTIPDSMKDWNYIFWQNIFPVSIFLINSEFKNELKIL